MVDAKVLTRSQMTRLLQESGEANASFQIPGYQMIEKLGKGLDGRGLQGQADFSVDRIVAIKILLDPLAQNKEFIKRFEREAMIAAKLSHNNVVNAIDAGRDRRPLLFRHGVRRGAHDQGLSRQEQGVRRERGDPDHPGDCRCPQACRGARA